MKLVRYGRAIHIPVIALRFDASGFDTEPTNVRRIRLQLRFSQQQLNRLSETVKAETRRLHPYLPCPDIGVSCPTNVPVPGPARKMTQQGNPAVGEQGPKRFHCHAFGLEPHLN